MRWIILLLLTNALYGQKSIETPYIRKMDSIGIISLYNRIDNPYKEEYEFNIRIRHIRLIPSFSTNVYNRVHIMNRRIMYGNGVTPWFYTTGLIIRY